MGQNSHLSLLQCVHQVFLDEGQRSFYLVYQCPIRGLGSSKGFSEHSWRADGFLSCFSDPVPSNVGVKSEVHMTPSSVLFCSTVFLDQDSSCQAVSDPETRWGKSFVISWFTLTLRAAADPQHPPQGFGVYPCHEQSVLETAFKVLIFQCAYIKLYSNYLI